MPRFAANLSLLFGEVPLERRFHRAAEAAFAAVEIQFPYDEDKQELARAAANAGVEVVLINAPAGDPAAPGLAGRPGFETAFRAGLDTALDYADALGATRINVLAGINHGDARECRALLVDNLAFAAERFEPHGITVCLEAVNTRDIPGYLVADIDDAARIAAGTGAANLGLQFDVYHAARAGLDPADALCRHIGGIAHVQFADCPGRHEPGSGRLPFAEIFDLLDELGYDGWTAAEYRPSRRTEDTLDWKTRYA